jgi:PAS domain S-box-containing protein
MPTFTPTITNILLVALGDERLFAELKKHGYNPLSVPDIKSIGRIDVAYSLMLLGETLLSNGESFDAERLYFLNNNVPTAVFIADPLKTSDGFMTFLSGSTFDWVYSHEVDSGLLCAKLDKMLIERSLNDNFRLLQQNLSEKQSLEHEISLRNRVLDHERELNANITGSITSGLLIIDLGGSVVMLNENARFMLKLGSSECIGLKFTALIPGKMRGVLEDFLKRVRSDSVCHQMKKISIESLVIEVSLYKMLDYHKDVSGVLMLINDITEQENTALQLYRAEKLATMGTMLSGIAHELRNPLSVISARAQMALAKNAWDQAWAVKNFESIEAQTCRCAAIINNLLDFSRYRATQMAVYAIDKILDETLTYVEFQNSFDSITIDKKYKKGLVVYGDQSRFVQVFLNVFTNASDAMNGKGALTISTTFEEPSWVVIEINDNGVGIDDKVKNKIFDPFFTTKEPGKGTGLGLAVVYKIIHESGGEVWFTTEPGNTSFFIKLPSGLKHHE